jgi:hypothetical protein
MKALLFVLAVLLCLLFPWHACFAVFVFVLFALLGVCLFCKSQENE